MKTEDEDGIDGPFNKAMDRAMKQDAKAARAAALAADYEKIKADIRSVGVRSRDRLERDHSYRAYVLGWIGGAVMPGRQSPSSAVADVRTIIKALDELIAEPFVIVPPVAAPGREL